jgi:hypothetical protein
METTEAERNFRQQEKETENPGSTHRERLSYNPMTCQIGFNTRLQRTLLTLPTVEISIRKFLMSCLHGNYGPCLTKVLGRERAS